MKTKNSVLKKVNDLIPSTSLIGRVIRFSLLLFVLAIPVYTYQTFVSDTTTILHTKCEDISGITAKDKDRIDELYKYAGGKDTVPVCTLLPVPSTDADLSKVNGLNQAIKYPIPFFGSIFYYLASNILVFASLAFLYLVIVQEAYPVLGRTYFRQFLTASAVFLLTVNVMLPTVTSVQLATLSQNAINKNELAVDNRLLCSNDHVFDMLKYHNAIPSVYAGYQIIPLENKPYNAIMCHGQKVKILENTKPHPAFGFFGHFSQFILNILLFLPIPFLLVLVLNLYKRLIHRILNR